MPQIQFPQPHPPIQGPTIQQTFPVPPISQPELRAYDAQQQLLRYQVPALPRVDIGPEPTILGPFQTTKASGTSSPLAVTMISAPSIGQVIIVCTNSIGAAARTVSSITLSGTTGWAKIGGTTNSTSSCEIWAGYCNASAGTALSITWSGTVTNTCAIVQVYSGIEIPKPGGATGAVTNTGTSTAPAIGTYTPGELGDLQICCAGYANGTAPTKTPAGPWANMLFINRSASLGLQGEYIRVSDSSAHAASWTITSAVWITVVAGFKPVSMPQPHLPLLQPPPSWYLGRDPRYLTPEAPRFDGAVAAIVQTVPNPAVSGPDLDTLYRPTQQNRYQVEAVKRFDGATVQQTFPVPPVSEPTGDWWRPDINRAQDWVGPVRLFDGRVQQATFPVPPVSQPELSWYERWKQAQRNNPEAVKQYQGATIQQEYIFPVTTLEASQWLASQRNRYLIDAVKFYEGATTLQTFPVPPLAQPTPDWWRPDINRAIDWVGPVRFFDGATVQQEYIFPVTTLERSVWLALERNRYQVGTTPRLETFVPGGAPQTYVFPLVALEISQWLARERNRFVLDAARQYDGATIQQEYIFPVSQPELIGYRALQSSRYLVGAVPRLETIVFLPQQYIFPVTGPEASQWLASQRNRYLVDAVRRFEGATIQRTDPVPPVSQPSIGWWVPDVNRAWIWNGPRQQFTGPTIQDTFPIPPISQPEAVRYALSKLGLGPNQPYPPARTEGATRQQTFPVPPVSQPELRAYLALHATRYMVGPPPRLEFIAQPTFIFPPSQPEDIAYAWLQYNRYLVLPAPILESILGISIIRPIGFAVYGGPRVAVRAGSPGSSAVSGSPEVGVT